VVGTVAVINHFAAKAAGHSGSGAASNSTEGSQAALPSWAIGPFERYANNPILAPPVQPTNAELWEWPELFNPGVVVVNGVFHMLYRGTNLGNVSAIGAATSADGYHFTPVSASPVIPHALPSENQGVEDPRLYYLAGKYYAFFTGVSAAEPGVNIDINEAVSSDAIHWRQLGPVLRNTKDAAVVADPNGSPVQIGGHYLMYYGQMGSIYLAQSTDLVHWQNVGAVDTRMPAGYGAELCVAVTSYRTAASGGTQTGIDLFVAGNLMGHGRWYYAISEIDFSRDHPLVASDLLSTPVLYPQAPYELFGHTPNTVFMNNLIFHSGQWWMYYGGGDSVVALAQAKLR
jgi:predicted GH43/DUF377 family glycosyl hydrolase